MKFLRITIYTAIERNQTLSKAQDVISSCEGWITNHSLFSNMAATLNFEIPFSQQASLISKLEAAGFTPETDGDFPINFSENEDIRGCLQLNFLHNDPDLKRDVPAFG